MSKPHYPQRAETEMVVIALRADRQDIEFGSAHVSMRLHYSLYSL